MSHLRAIVRRILNAWLRLTLPENPSTQTLASREKHRKAEVLSLTMLCTMLLTASQMVSYGFDQHWLSFTFMGISQVGIIWALILNRRMAVFRASCLFLGVVTVSSFAGIPVDYPGLRVFDWIIASLPILLSGLFLPSWSPFLFAGADIAFAVIATLTPELRASFVPLRNADLFLSTIGLIDGALACIGSLYAWSTERAIAVANRAEEWQSLSTELAEKNSQLQATASDLTLTQSQLLANNAALSEMNQRLERLATYDPLTDIYNHRKMAQELELLNVPQSEISSRFVLLFMDIDHFKNINDTFGHAAGDEVLKEFANVIQSHLRPVDRFGRWGGEEFIIIAPLFGKEEGIALAERLRQLIATHHFDFSGEHVTCSIGVTYSSGDDPIEAIVDRADQAMYLAKQQGRNQVCLHETLSEQARVG